MNSQFFLPEFEREMDGTRRVLERVPDEHLDWRPHEKSFTLRELATHVATLPRWIPLLLTTPEIDYLTLPPTEWGTSASDMVARLDAFVEESREQMAAAASDAWGESWSLQYGDQEIFSLPRAEAYRSFVMNHLIHHRAQLTVYLRLLNAAVPGLYGPSADEK